MCEDNKIITGIEVQKKNKDRVNIFINGSYAFSCSAELVYTHKLTPKKEVEINQLEELVYEDNFLKCKNDALRIIERTYKSEKEIFDKLVKKDYEEKTVARVISFLKSYNFLNDEEYARLYINDKKKTQGKNKIKYALLRKGIDEALVEEKLKKVTSDEQERTAQALTEKKYRLLIKQEKDIRKINNKLWEYLTRNGFNKEIIEEVLQKIVSFEKQNIEDEESGEDLEELNKLAEKRYSVLIKSEQDSRKLYKKLADYLLRRGFSWDNVKKAVNSIVNSSEFDENV